MVLICRTVSLEKNVNQKLKQKVRWGFCEHMLKSYPLFKKYVELFIAQVTLIFIEYNLDGFSGETIAIP